MCSWHDASKDYRRKRNETHKGTSKCSSDLSIRIVVIHFFGTENSSAVEILLKVRFIAEVNVGITYKWIGYHFPAYLILFFSKFDIIFQRIWYYFSENLILFVRKFDIIFQQIWCYFLANLMLFSSTKTRSYCI